MAVGLMAQVLDVARRFRDGWLMGQVAKPVVYIQEGGEQGDDEEHRGRAQELPSSASR